MSIHVMVHLEEHDRMEAEMRTDELGRYLSIHLGPDVTLFVHENRTRARFNDLRKFFGLQEKTAPGVDSEDGVPGGKEPAQEMVPQKI